MRSICVGNMIGHQWIDGLCAFSNLTELRIEGTNLDEVTNDEAFRKLEQMRGLKSFTISSNVGGIPFTLVAALTTFHNLEYLKIELNKNRFQCFEALLPLRKLQKLVLKYVDPDELDYSVFIELKQLRYLEIFLKNPFLMNTNQEAARRICDDVESLLKEWCKNLKQIVVNQPKKKITR
eukprot:TRINITY_DN9462_c1_g1_i1.p2 TRINITY_DN9462_c1_g1~~TRINITY_DN9462_c1_g1_i1.p2  ORF type:complete len:179 (+),score=21.97 TRINITY_DN9462_c1_g1_i1:72-608(+)